MHRLSDISAIFPEGWEGTEREREKLESERERTREERRQAVVLDREIEREVGIRERENTRGEDRRLLSWVQGHAKELCAAST